MSKIDEIEVRFDKHERNFNLYIDDVPYLLSKLEIAEKALEDVIFETDVPMSDVAAIKRLSTEALQQLRE